MPFWAFMAGLGVLVGGWALLAVGFIVLVCNALRELDEEGPWLDTAD